MYDKQPESVLQRNKLLGLEVIRFTSALAVLLWHYQHFSYLADKPADFVTERQPFYSFLHFFYDYGYQGVHVFWCVSGFIFFWKYRDAIASKIVSGRKFFVLRFSRLYPLHFATLLLVLMLQVIYFSQKSYFFVYQNNDVPHFILQLFLASNWGLEKGDSFNGPIWSISVEVLVYICFFIALRFISKSFLVNLAVLLFCLVAKYFKVSNSIFNCLALFYVGGLSAMAFLHWQERGYKIFLTRLAFVAVLVFPPIIHATSIYQLKYFPELFLVTYVPALLFVCAQNFRTSPILHKMIEAAGNMTYSSYLIHFPIQLVIASYFANIHEAIPYYSDAFFVGFILATLVASYYIYRLFELPAQIFLRKKLA